MKKRGLNKGWTEEMDKIVLSGARVEGFTPQENCFRRYTLKKLCMEATLKTAKKFSKNVALLKVMKQEPRSLSATFLKNLENVIAELEELNNKKLNKQKD